MDFVILPPNYQKLKPHSILDLIPLEYFLTPNGMKKIYQNTTIYKITACELVFPLVFNPIPLEYFVIYIYIYIFKIILNFSGICN
jgi:hypothetical protein